MAKKKIKKFKKNLKKPTGKVGGKQTFMHMKKVKEIKVY